uniref:Ribonuclease Z n=1 Tax=Nitophyllum punctatum TaxID=158729 RepID=A0A4D6WY53_9FLOR|nr:ribonuclease Z [Nitophyllum punctatum]
MQFSYLNNKIGSLYRSDTSFMINFIAIKDIWIFNCSEGCQYNTINNESKINNVSKIIITDLYIHNTSGLLGLLSSLNLIGRTKDLHIYGPKNLANYLDLSKKYSHTNFSYTIYIHVLAIGLVINTNKYRVYTLGNKNQYQFFIMQSEYSGKFFLSKAKKSYLIQGPLYGKLKKGSSFILPDGHTLYGCQFTISHLIGLQLCFVVDKYYNRVLLESSWTPSIIVY